MFVRAKTVKGKKYAYLVKNVCKKGKVKQITKKYLGKIIDLSETKQKVEENNESFFENNIDFSQNINSIMKQLIINEFESLGFVFDSKHTLRKGEPKSKEEIIIKLTKKVKFLQNKKHVVLFFNNRYVYPKLIELLLDFYEPESEDDKKGEKLAFRLRDAGINIEQEDFIQLYRLIYLSNNEN